MKIFFNIDIALQNVKSVSRLVLDLPLYKGQSFLLNYGKLKALYWKYNETDVINYIIIASLRDYKHCVTYNDFSVERDLVPLDNAQLKINELLWQNNSRIYLKFEEEACTQNMRKKYGN